MQNQVEPIIACTLTDPAQRRAREAEVGNLFQTCQAVAELPDGYTLRFAGDTATFTQLCAFLREERQCCPFFTFELLIAPDLGPLSLSLRGSPAVKAFIRDALLPTFSPEPGA